MLYKPDFECPSDGNPVNGNFRGRYKDYRSFESILPSHRYRGALPRESTCLSIISFIPGIFWQSASWVPCMVDELIRPLRGHPFSTRKGGARLSAFLFLHMCLEGVVQNFTSPALSPLWGALPRESTCLWIISFIPGTFWQLASQVPCEIVQPIPRLRRYLPIPGKVGPDCLLSFFFICALKV